MAATRSTPTSTTLFSWSVMAQRTVQGTGLSATPGDLLGEKLAISEFSAVLTSKLTAALTTLLWMVVLALVRLLQSLFAVPAASCTTQPTPSASISPPQQTTSLNENNRINNISLIL